MSRSIKVHTEELVNAKVAELAVNTVLICEMRWSIEA
jgi:hypothetical protein